MRVCIVEDEKEFQDTLVDFLKKYGSEKNCDFTYDIFPDAISFLDNYKKIYDIIFMDIRMQYLDGMAAAHKLREIDDSTVLIFVTSLAQYAIESYSVNATDYILKPIKYPDFALKLTRAIKKIDSSNTKVIPITVKGVTNYIDINDVYYVESLNHQMTYHTAKGEFITYETLTNIEKQLKDYNFVRCNACYLVNLKYVTSIKGYTCEINNDQLAISQPKKKAFVKAIEQYNKK